jgi:hypothetical protein
MLAAGACAHSPVTHAGYIYAACTTPNSLCALHNTLWHKLMTVHDFEHSHTSDSLHVCSFGTHSHVKNLANVYCFPKLDYQKLIEIAD